MLGAVHFIHQHWREALATGKPLCVEIWMREPIRALRQNRRYWAQLREIAEQAVVEGRRYSKDAWHVQFRTMFLGTEDLPYGGSAPMSTRTLGMSAFDNYRLQVEAFAVTELSVRFSQ